MNFKNYYEEFGISENATQEEIKNAYKKLAKKYHPDANPNLSEIERKEREEKLKEINEYKDILTNEKLKEEYDQQLQEYKIEVERRQQEEQIRRQYEEELKKYQRQKYYEESKKNKENIEPKSTLEKIKHLHEEYKQAYREAIREERRCSFVKRHSNIDKKFYNEYYRNSNNIIINLGNQLGRITLHTLGEFITQGERMFKFKGVSVPKYIMRNRYNLAAGAIILTMTFNPFGGLINDKDEKVKTTENKIEDIIDSENYQSTYTLNKYHIIEGGETLSQLAYEAGTSSNNIRRPEVEGDGYFLQVGEKVIIPYQVSQEDLEYYTYTEKFLEKTSLEEFAQIYNTDVETLRTLNPDAIFVEAGKYYVISDTLLVPNFITQEELQSKKESAKQYQ